MLYNNPAGYAGLPPTITNFIMLNSGNREPRNSGQYGLAGRYYIPAIATELGAYYVNYHQRGPVISVLFNASQPNSVFSLGANRLQYAWDWTAEDIKVFGLSFSTVVGGVSLFGEASFTEDYPLQINGVDLLRGGANGAGPLAFLQPTPRNVGNFFTGYDRKDKTQVQLSASRGLYSFDSGSRWSSESHCA